MHAPPVLSILKTLAKLSRCVKQLDAATNLVEATNPHQYLDAQLRAPTGV